MLKEIQRSEKIRLGVIGCGPATFNAYADAIVKAAHIQLQALSDPDPVRLAAVSDRLRPLRTYPDRDELLADPRVDLVLIAGDHAFDATLVQEVLAAGKHVLVANSFGIPLEACERLRPFAERKTLALDCHRRFLPGVRATRQFLADEAGEVTSYAGYYFDNSYWHTASQPNALRAANRDCKIIDKRLQSWLAHGPQIVDMARHLLGPISAIRATHTEVTSGQTMQLGSSGTSSGHAWGVDLRFAGGSRGQCSILLHRSGTFEEGFELQADGGSVTCGYPCFWFHREHTRIYSAARQLHWSPDSRDCHTYRLQLEALAQSILTGAPEEHAGFEDGVACSKALLAGTQSALHGGRWVDVEQQEEDEPSPYIRAVA